MSIGKVGSERVLEKGLGEYRKGKIQASTGKVGFERVLEKGRIRASTEKGRILVSIGNGGI